MYSKLVGSLMQNAIFRSYIYTLQGQPYSDTAELLAGLDTIEPKYFDPTFTPEVSYGIILWSVYESYGIVFIKCCIKVL